MDRNRFEVMYAPKVGGAKNLYSEVKALVSLDFFMVFSSIASLMGGSGQTNYSAANAVLDSLIIDARNSGIRGICAQWGAVSDVGMGARSNADTNLQKKGFMAVEPDMVLNALKAIFNAADSYKVAVVPVIWERYLRPKSGHPATPFYSMVLSQA